MTTSNPSLMTSDELRAFCLSLPGATEKETWGTGGGPGHPTFRVRDRIFASLALDGSHATIHTTVEQLHALIASHQDAVAPAAHVGRFGWARIDLAALEPALVRELVVDAWRRTAPGSMVAAFQAQKGAER